MLKTILDFIFNKPKPVQDALLDTRQQSEKDKDWLDIEFAAGPDDYDWQEEPNLIEAPFYPYFQLSSLSCVALFIALSLEEFWARVGKIVVSSRKDFYFWRFNKPSGGMTADDAVKLGKRGVALESQVPSQGLGESAMNTQYVVTQEILDTRTKNKIKGAIYVKNFNNIDDIAKASRNSPVSIFIYFDSSLQYREWWTAYPRVVNNNLNLYADDTSRHHVSVASSKAYKVLGAVLINGIKHLKIQDSAGHGTGIGKNKNIRYVSEDFVKRRNYTAFFALPEDIKIEKPKSVIWTGKRNLTLNMFGEDVKQLQQILQIEDCFNYPNPTGYFGGITRAGVIKLQNKYKSEILTPAGLKGGTGFVGQSTLKWLDKNYK